MLRATSGGQPLATGSSPTFAGLTLTGNLSVQGNTTLGNATGDTITFTGRMATGITWGTDNGSDIGASGANRPRTMYLGTSLSVIGTVSGTGVVAVGNGTAPTAQVDTVALYSTDDAAGHTIPSFFCEGTNVLATGQADSASSVRVKMRINGTVVTLLAI